MKWAPGYGLQVSILCFPSDQAILGLPVPFLTHVQFSNQPPTMRSPSWAPLERWARGRNTRWACRARRARSAHSGPQAAGTGQLVKVAQGGQNLKPTGNKDPVVIDSL